MHDKHLFAFYSPVLMQGKRPVPGQSYVCADKELAHRLERVVRLKKGARLMLFGQGYVLEASFVGASSVGCEVQVMGITPVVAPEPAITWLLPLMDKEALEAAIYALSVMAVENIRLVITDKIHKHFFTEKEYARLQRIMIAASEQAKQFVIPTLFPPRPLPEVLLLGDAAPVKLFFDAKGKAPEQWINLLKDSGKKEIIVLSGPEADLSADEKQKLLERGFLFCALTPTILKAEHAVMVASGIIRSFLC